MVDLNSEMAELWGSLNGARSGPARVLQIVSARRGEGSSVVARELACYVARQMGRSVWLVDVDLGGVGQHQAIKADAERYGTLGEPVSATPDGSMFLTVRPPMRGGNGQIWPASRFVTASRVGQAKWWVTRFRKEAVQDGQSLHILPTPDYWSALSRHTDLVIIDTPSADRSRASLTLAPFADQTVLVVAADQADTQAPRRLSEAISQAGGTVSGLFLNRVTVEAPKFLKALGL